MQSHNKPTSDASGRAVELSSSRRPLFRSQFLVSILLVLFWLCIIYWNRTSLFERLRDAQIPEPERSQRKAFANQMEALQNQGEYAAMRKAAAGWRQTHAADPNGYAVEGYAAYFMGDIDACDAAWKRAAQMDPLMTNGMESWLYSTSEVRDRWNHPLPTLVLVDSDVTKAEKLWNARAIALIKAKKYDEIETVAQGLLQSKAMLPDGKWLLTTFFESVAELPDEQSTPENWKAKLVALQGWQQARPNSRLARLAVTDCWVDGAWMARGNGNRDTIATTARQDMRQRLGQAAELLLQEKNDTLWTPLYVYTFHLFSQLAGIEGPDYDRVIERSLKFYPAYSEAVFSKAVHIQPRWYGEPGQWEAFVAKQADAVGGIEGDILYARVLWRLQRLLNYRATWKETNASWPRTKRGFRALLKRYPHSLATAHAAFILSTQAGDYPFARQLLRDHIAGKVDRDRWKDLHFFAPMRMWVVRQG